MEYGTPDVFLPLHPSHVMVREMHNNAWPQIKYLTISSSITTIVHATKQGCDYNCRSREGHGNNLAEDWGESTLLVLEIFMHM